MFLLLNGAQAPTQQETLKTILDKKPAQVQQQKVEPITYTVQDGDNLTKIAEKYNTTWLRLWNKNASLINQDSLLVGTILTIPTADETLAERPLYTVPVPENVPQAATTPHTSVSRSKFEWGWCTYYADQQRPDIGATGNAADWIRYANSPTPVVGSVAVNTTGYGHVAIVISVGNGKVLVRHMNWRGFGVVSEDWVNTSYWAGYIL